MNAQTKVEASPLAKLREPFPDHQISKLPKETRAQIDQRKADRNAMVFNCPVCSGHHHKNAVHLDYVGHAALTDRLLDTDPEWNWEPMGQNEDGTPALDINGGLWIKLTVCGVTRPGYGSADGKSGGDAIKEIIGDALRNAAMRFGAALDLWHKGELHAEEPGERTQDGMPDAEWSKLTQLCQAARADTTAMLRHYGVKDLRQLNHDQYGQAIKALNKKLAQLAKEQSNGKASTLAEELGDAIQF